MTERGEEAQSRAACIELGVDTLDDVPERLDASTVRIPIPAIGSANSYLDICHDLIRASWAAEQLASNARTIVAREVRDPPYTSAWEIDASDIGPGFHQALRRCALLFDDDQLDNPDREELVNEVADHEDDVSELDANVPDLVDAYLANLVTGAYSELRHEDPDVLQRQLTRFPERAVGYWRSAHSGTLGGEAYASTRGWLLSNTVSLQAFFERFDQKFRTDDLLDAEILHLAGASFVIAEGVAAAFPIHQYLKSRMCASHVSCENDEPWPPEDYDWSNIVLPGGAPQPHPWQEAPSCRIDRTGSLIVLSDGQFQHLLYDVRPLSLGNLKAVHHALSTTAGRVAVSFRPTLPELDWGSLSDEAFECLCYDIIYVHPRFDETTIRKHGKSRSRDGGRDIEVRERRALPHEPGRKWIFQCKRVAGQSSLSASRLQDVGDMIDQHGVGGYGIMTSAAIDSTLYDKLDKVCGRRGVELLTYSFLELERTVAHDPVLWQRYFGGAKAEA